MVIAVYSLGKVYGAELWFLFCLFCVLVYVGGSLSIKENRSKEGIRNVWIGLLIAEEIIDIVWAVLYYRHGGYSNYGIGAGYGLLLWIPVLLITAACVTIKNRKKIKLRSSR